MQVDIFLDRDGTLIRDTGYISKKNDVEVLEGVIDGLKLFREKGYRLHIVSNQSGVPRGIISELEFREVERHIDSLFLGQGIVFDSHNYCFHLPTDGCECRKPKSGLFENVSSEYAISELTSAMVGDSEVDMEAAKNFGIPFWKVELPEVDFYEIARKVVRNFEGF